MLYEVGCFQIVELILVAVGSSEGVPDQHALVLLAPYVLVAAVVVVARFRHRDFVEVRIAQNRVSRSEVAAGVPDAPYLGGAISGVWKTTDCGAWWDPVFDSANGMSSIGDVTGAPSDPNAVWVGTGEADNRPSYS